MSSGPASCWDQSVDVVLAPDIYGNASVELGSPPEEVTHDGGNGKSRCRVEPPLKIDEWLLTDADGTLCRPVQIRD